MNEFNTSDVTQQLNPPTKPTSRNYAAMILLLVVVLVAVYGAIVASHWIRVPPLEELANYTLAHGNSSSIPTLIANLFSIPDDDQPFRAIEVPSADGHIHAALVRARPKGDDVDIILRDTASDGTAYHYLTSPDAQLIKALHSNAVVADVSDAEGRFVAEVKFWQKYLENNTDQANRS